MKHLDITIDIETLALSTNAAILQVAAVAWDRNNPDTPFVDVYFNGYVDIRSCVSDGFDFEPHAIKWWSEQTDETKESVLTPAAHPLKDVLESLSQWISETKIELNADSVCLWAQGSDFDIANLRNAFARYDINFPVDYRYFRDARTFILEVGSFILMHQPFDSYSVDMNRIYEALPEVEDDAFLPHNALCDAHHTTFNVWYLLQRLRSMANMNATPSTSSDTI